MVHPLTEILQLVSSRVKPGGSLIHRRLVGPRVDLEQQITSLDRLIVDDGQLDNGTRDPGSHLHHSGRDLAVSGPGVDDVVAVFPDHRRDGGQHHEGGEKVTPQLAHNGMIQVPIPTMYRAVSANSTNGG